MKAEPIAVTESPAAPTTPSSAETEAWKNLASLWLDAIARQAVQYCPSERATFTGRIEQSKQALHNDAGVEVPSLAESVAEALERYNTQTQRRFDELVERFRTLTKALIERGPGPSAALKEGLGQLLAAKEMPDLEARLTACVEAAEAPGAWAALSPRLETVASLDSFSNANQPDPGTGLPTAADGEAAIRQALADETQTYVATLCLHRLNLITARFGDSIGNQVLLFCSQHIATHLTGPRDALFRWHGPGFVALLERNDSAQAVASDVQRFISMPLSRFFETHSRTVYLPLKLTGDVLPLAGTKIEEVLKHVHESLYGRSEGGD